MKDIATPVLARTAVQKATMRLNPIALGNGIGSATAILFVVCYLLAFVAQDLALRVGRSIFHFLSLETMAAAPKMPFDLGNFALGLIVLSASMWIFGWLFGKVYNLSSGPGAAS